LESLHNPEDEPLYEDSFTFDFEQEELSRERIQELIWLEIREFHPHLPPNYPGSKRKVRSPSESKESKHSEEKSAKEDK